MEENKMQNGAFLTDKEKRHVLEDLKCTLDPTILTNDFILAKNLSRISKNVGHLAQSAQTPSDISFTVNLVDFAVDRVTSHLESNDPTRELFHDFATADGISLASWCPGGYEELVEITRSSLPIHLGFQKCATLRDIEEGMGDSKGETVKERKKRSISQQAKAQPVEPKKIVELESIQTHKVNMEKALNVLVDLNTPISFYKFVINPRSFVQTVYNLFLISFLVHEKHAILTVSDNHELFIQCASEGIDDVEADSNIQLIQSLSPLEWSALSRHLQLDKSILPDFCPKDSQCFQNSQLADSLSIGVTFLDP